MDNNLKALKALELRYNNIIGERNASYFLNGIAKYTELAESLQPLQPAIKALEEQEKAQRKMLESIDLKSFKEFEESAQKMANIVSKVYKNIEPIASVMERVNKQISGAIQAYPKLTCLDHTLFDLAREIKSIGGAEYIKEFEDKNTETKNIYGNYTFSPTYKDYLVSEERFEELEDNEPWGAWSKIHKTKLAIKEPRKDSNTLEGIIVYEIKDNNCEDVVVAVRLKDLRKTLNIAHLYFQQQLLLLDNQEKYEEYKMPTFDEKDSILNFKNKKILISKTKNTKSHDLFKALFKKPNLEWNQDEIVSEWEGNTRAFVKNAPKNTVYQVGRYVNSIIAKKTQIEDFLIMRNTRTIQINPKYLKT